jgi:hypothetical protein
MARLQRIGRIAYILVETGYGIGIPWTTAAFNAVKTASGRLRIRRQVSFSDKHEGFDLL